MSARLDYVAVAPDLLKPMLALEHTVRNAGLGQALLELVKIRASQINGCAFCIYMHATDARKHGETEMRLHLTAAWRESTAFTPRERAALAWTEALTLLPQSQAPDDVYAEVAAHFDERERVALTLLIVTINGWNRLAMGFRSQHPALESTAREAA
ncbi:carboxymuconolactone decarboxylase family protein [Achromobacter sp. GG226]|uniref:carboxymuconolactone decarboxylase family protein n=1 Tax=Verticiella alkaliphila TaxID=2779529 RepID=UPI001C0C8116|nr:carboxymuconolactone decarboxylase family protein [Verticiella sp. GG226]MBU4609685.1 carboxymuconolactone decarboxylase family protein [Verticiella sp. GG226]